MAFLWRGGFQKLKPQYSPLKWNGYSGDGNNSTAVMVLLHRRGFPFYSTCTYYPQGIEGPSPPLQASPLFNMAHCSNWLNFIGSGGIWGSGCQCARYGYVSVLPWQTALVLYTDEVSGEKKVKNQMVYCIGLLDCLIAYDHMTIHITFIFI